MITRGAFAHSGSSSGGDEEETTNSTSLETTVPSSDNSSDENSCVATQLEVPVTHTIPAIRSTRNALLESEDEKEVAPEPPPRPPLTSRTTSPGNSLVRGGFVSISSEEMVVYSTIGATPEPQSRHPSTLRTTSPSTLSLR
uniref:hypothetical protein n=1 Tax=Candidatus Ichthyocystis hellenicum TaxID=1561003 RepID=UPI001112A96A